jgi:predicted amino acid-binding ACT domain protein
MHEYVLTLSARDAKGIVYAVSGLLYQAGCNIIDSQQFGDLEGEDASGWFFMRVHFEAPAHLSEPATLGTLFEHVRQQYGMSLAFHPCQRRARLLLMVSQHGHCLNDLLFRWHGRRPRGAGALHADPVGSLRDAAVRADHQHPPLLPAQLQGRQALSPGARARRQADRGHGALRDPTSTRARSSNRRRRA